MILLDSRSEEETTREAAELRVFRTLNTLLTNTTEFSSLPLRCSTSCSHVLKMQFPLPRWRFWQIMEINSFEFCPYFYGAWDFHSALLCQEHLLLGSCSRDGMINDVLWAQPDAWLEWLTVSWTSKAWIPLRRSWTFTESR
jgi:hypothetical protein